MIAEPIRSQARPTISLKPLTHLELFQKYGRNQEPRGNQLGASARLLGVRPKPCLPCS